MNVRSWRPKTAEIIERIDGGSEPADIVNVWNTFMLPFAYEKALSMTTVVFVTLKHAFESALLLEYLDMFWTQINRVRKNNWNSGWKLAPGLKIRICRKVTSRVEIKNCRNDTSGSVRNV